MIMCFFFHFIYMVYYIDRFSYVEPSLYLWDEVHLVIVYDFFDIFLDSVCEYFIKYFCIYVHERDWSVIPFLSNAFVLLSVSG